MNLESLAIFNRLVQFVLNCNKNYFKQDVYFEHNKSSGFYYIACDNDPFWFACRDIDSNITIQFYDTLEERDVIFNDYQEAEREYEIYLQREKKQYDDVLGIYARLNLWLS
jgi:hypothetical protein